MMKSGGHPPRAALGIQAQPKLQASGEMKRGMLLGYLYDRDELSTEKKMMVWLIEDYRFCSYPTLYESQPFMFASTSWCIQMTPPKTLNDFLEVSLKNKTTVNYRVMVSFEVRREGTYSYETRILPTPFEKGRSYPFLTGAFLNEKQLKYIDYSGTLRIGFQLELIQEKDLKRKLVHTADHMNLSGLEALSRNLKDLFSNEDDCDALLIVQGREFKAHRLILTARSSVFAAMFRHDTVERKTGQVTIPDCDSDTFHEFLEYLYCGRIAAVSWDNVFHLYTIADKYNVQELKTVCVNHIMQKLTIQNIYDVAAFAEEHDETDLFALVQECFTDNFVGILKTSEWETLFKNNFPLATKLLTEMAKTKK